MSHCIEVVSLADVCGQEVITFGLSLINEGGKTGLLVHNLGSFTFTCMYYM